MEILTGMTLNCRLVRRKRMQGIDVKKTGQKIKEMCRIRNITVKDIQ